MHTIVGFIQVLLMLTQSRLMPDLQGWFETKTVSEKQLCIPGGFHPATVNKKDVHFFALIPEKKFKISPRLSYVKPEGLFIAKTEFKKASPVFCEKKRYLVFCQLKTEG